MRKLFLAAVAVSALAGVSAIAQTTTTNGTNGAERASQHRCDEWDRSRRGEPQRRQPACECAGGDDGSGRSRERARTSSSFRTPTC